MKVHTNQIPPEGVHLEGAEPPEILEMEDERARAAGDVHYSLDVGLSQGGLFATGWLRLDLSLQCVRCLGLFPYRLKVDDFAVQIELEGRDVVDLTPMIREDILLALPSYPHCDHDADRECQGMSRPDGAEKSVEGKTAPWEILDKLKPETDT